MSRELSRVALLSRTLPSYRIAVCDALAARHEVHVLLAGRVDDAMPAAASPQAGAWHRHDLRTSRRGWRGEVVRSLATLAPDVILMEHGAALDFSWTGLLSRRLASIPKVLWTHGVERHERMGRGSRAGRVGRALQLRLADAIVTYDRHGAEAVRHRFPGKPVFVAPNSTDGTGITARREALKLEGVAAHRRRRGLEHRSYLFALGRLIAEKRLEQIIAIVARLKSQGVSVGAIIVGDGPERSALHAATLAAGLSVGHDIVFAGRVEAPAELAEWMYAADLAVLPGYVGLAVIDGMFGGLPLVSAVPGADGPFHAPEWFAAQESGLGIGVEGDDPAAWAEAIAGYLSRPEAARREQSEACATYAREHFGIEPLVAGLEQAIDWAHDSRRPAAAPLERYRLEPFGVSATALGFEEVVGRVMRWTHDPGRGRFVCLANVHMLIEATRHRRVSRALGRADLVLTDGMPLVWLMSKQTSAARRIAGMDLLPALCRAAAEQGVPVFFVGSTDECLRAVRARLEREHPRLRIAGMQPASIGRLSRTERGEIGARIGQSGARLVFVALGCPRQELWMDRHRDSLGAVLVGVGGAVDVYAGLRRRAPRALQARGLEWIYRFGQEPLRLWRRYLVTNSTFLWLLLRHRLWGRSGG